MDVAAQVIIKMSVPQQQLKEATEETVVEMDTDMVTVINDQMWTESATEEMVETDEMDFESIRNSTPILTP